MTRGGASRAALVKEIRAQLPLWAACLAALAGAFFRRRGLIMDAAVVAYIMGPLAIGAQSVGQEYGYRTLPILLAQPVDRRRIYRLKFLVSAVMVLTLAAIASQTVAREIAGSPTWQRVSVQALPIAGGLFVAPWFTMLTRSVLAGILFTASLASLTNILAIVTVTVWSGVGAGPAQAMILGPWSAAMLAFCAAGAWLGPRHFARLEAIDGAVGSLTFPGFLKQRAGTRVRQPLRALAMKELHLQQLTLAIAAIFTPGTVLLAILQRTIPAWSNAPIGAVVLLYCMCLAIVIGALASAEERQNGTLEWQLLQPAAAWLQWLVKVAVTLTLALILGAALPGVLLRLTLGSGVDPITIAVPVLLLTAGSLYISSLAASGVRAMMLVLPAGVVASLFLQALDRMLPRSYFVSPLLLARAPNAIALLVLPLLIWFGFVNHGSAERRVGRIVQQLSLLAAAVVIGITLGR